MAGQGTGTHRAEKQTLFMWDACSSHVVLLPSGCVLYTVA